MKRIGSMILILVMLSMLFVCPLQASAAMSSDAINWYKSKLNYLHDHPVYGNHGRVNEMSSKFALIDIDGDGVDELIADLYCTDNGMLGTAEGRIYCYDKGRSTITESAGNPYIISVYQNGYIAAFCGNSDTPDKYEWPFAVFRYNSATKKTQLIFVAHRVTEYDEEYSYLDDADHDGVIYTIDNGDPLTEAQYNAYVNRYIPAKNKRNVVWYKMSKTNISKLSNQMLSQEFQLEKPRITRVDNVNSGAKITWNKVPGAQRYAVFMVYDGLHWKRIATTTANSYLHKINDSGGLYFYTVRCMSADGTAFTSGYYPAGYGNIFIAPPKAPTLTRTSSGIRIKWKKPDGAEKFRVFRKTGSGKWQKVGDTTSTQWTNKSVKKGVKYTYTVRCISADGKQYVSGYNTKGTSMTY